jgi:MraZ protein
MFLSTWEVRLDSKNRVTVPQKIREPRTEGGRDVSNFYLTLGSEGCIFVYTEEGWERLVASLGANQPIGNQALRKLQRLVGGSTTPVTCDSAGRITLSAALREHAGLKRDVIWVGAVGRGEIWDSERWQQYSETHVSELGATLDEIISQTGLTLPGIVTEKPDGNQGK